MGFCRSCGSQLNAEKEFCPQCGKKVERPKSTKPTSSEATRTSSKPKQPLFNSKKSKILTICGIILIALLISGYFIVRQLTAPLAVAERFIDAVQSHNVAAVKKFINEGQIEMEADDEQVGEFLVYLQDNPRLITSMSEGLINDAKKLEGQVFVKQKQEAPSFVKLIENGGKWLFFTDYTVQVQTYYVDVTSDLDQTDIFFNDEKVGTIDHQEDTFGPFLPGEYTVKAIYEGDFGEVEQEQEVETSAFASQTKTLSFSWAEYFIPVYTNYEDAVLYVNNQSTKMQIGELDQIGPVPLDGSVKVLLQKKFKNEVKRSKEITLTKELVQADLFIDYVEPEPEPEPKPEPQPQQPITVEVVTPTIPYYTEDSYEDSAIRRAVLHHYNSISADDYSAAYDLFSTERKGTVKLKDWSKGLKENIRDEVTVLTVTEINGGTARAYVEMTSYDQKADGKILVQEWGGNWNLVKENDGWKLHKADIEKRSSRTE